MQPVPDGLDQLKQRMRDTWRAGDFGQIARYSAKSAEQFVDRLQIQPGARVLDVACGTGNLAIPPRARAHKCGASILLRICWSRRARGPPPKAWKQCLKKATPNSCLIRMRTS